MTGAIGDTLLLGLGMALNPIAIVISILVANRPNARRNGTALVIGWVLGLSAMIVLATILVRRQLSLPSGVLHGEDFALFRAVLGVLLLVGAIFPLRNRPLPGEEPKDPRWARVLDAGGVGRVFGVGLFLALVNVRNLILLAAAASVVGQAQVSIERLSVVIALFVATASLGILVPLLIALLGGDAVSARLAALAGWLTRNMGVITGGIMALFGVVLIVRGLQGIA